MAEKNNRIQNTQFYSITRWKGNGALQKPNEITGIEKLQSHLVFVCVRWLTLPYNRSIVFHKIFPIYKFHQTKNKLGRKVYGNSMLNRENESRTRTQVFLQNAFYEINYKIIINKEHPNYQVTIRYWIPKEMTFWWSLKRIPKRMEIVQSNNALT